MFHLLDSHELAIVIVHAQEHPPEGTCSDEIPTFPVHDAIWKAGLGFKGRLCSNHICTARSQVI